ncbi:MAG: ATP phosphoribosyltransferase regulatory subunit [Bacillota bacterium]|nr:ATP phosphoribosyltransferase regulatory subunit [Bacillota bacterium]
MADPTWREEGAASALLRHRIERTVLEVLARWGYREVETPLLEPVEGELRPAAGAGGAAGEAGHLGEEERWFGAVRLMDGGGRPWRLRYDATVALLRRAPELASGGAGLRLAYATTVVRRDEEGEPVALGQAGAEYLSAPSPLGEAEAVGAAVDVLRALGAGPVRVALGDTALVTELERAAGLPETGEAGTSALLEALRAGDHVRAAGLDRVGLAELGGGVAQVRERLRASGGGAERDRFLALLEHLVALGLGERLEVDLQLVGRWPYYAGPVFELTVPAQGQPLGYGGRYRLPGGAREGVGFALDVGRLAALLAGPGPRPEEAAPDVVAFPAAAPPGAIWPRLAALRRAGYTVALAPDEVTAFRWAREAAAAGSSPRLLRLEAGGERWLGRPPAAEAARPGRGEARRSDGEEGAGAWSPRH